MQSKKCAHARYTNVDTYAYGSVRMYVYVYVRTYIIAYPLLVVPWEGKPSRWFLAGMAHYLYRCYIYKAPHTYVHVRRYAYVYASAGGALLRIVYVSACPCARTYVCTHIHVRTYVRTYMFTHMYARVFCGEGC